MFKSLFPSSEIAQLLRDLDWSQHPLGVMESWPQSLKTVTALVLESQVPAYLVWGSDRYFIYNDAYIGLIDPHRHPAGFGRPFNEVWPEVKAEVGAMMDRAMLGEKVVFNDLAMTLYTGANPEPALRYFSFSLSPLRGDSMQIEGVLCNCFETTDRVRSEQSLRQSQENLKLSLLGARMGTWAIDLETEEIEFSEETAAIYGVSKRIFKYPDFDLIINREDAKRITEKLTATLNDGVDFDDEYQITRPDGQVRWISSRGRCVFHEGKLRKVTGVLTDITESKLAQDRLKESEAKFRTIADAMPQMVWSTLHDGYHDYYNKRWYEFTGTPEGSTDGEGWNDMFHPDDQERAKNVWAESLRTGKPYEIRYRLRHHSGTYRWTLGRALPIFDESHRIIRWMGTCTDIHQEVLQTEELELARANAERARLEAERANQLKSDFLANMSHEIRTPLGAMMGFADLLRDPATTPTERSSYVDILHRNGESLAVIINDILDLSKVEAGHLTLEYLETRPEQIVADVTSLLRVKAKEKGLVLESTFDSEVPPVITADPVRVRQILLNIVGNAIKFTQFGSVSIRVSATHTKSGHHCIHFEVADTGIGIPADQHEHVFEMFTQADGTMTRRFGGTGLGLALSRRLAQAMNGDVKIVDSRPGVGTRFLITIEDQPEIKIAATSVAQEKKISSPPPEAQSLAGVKILVIDDAPDNQHLLWRYLTKHGAIVQTVDNGLLGYRTALVGDFDVVLMDIQMPVMDGYTATSKLREAGYQKPVIALTAHAMNEVRKKALNVGYTDHLTKPINQVELIHTILRHARGT